MSRPDPRPLFHSPTRLLVVLLLCSLAAATATAAERGPAVPDAEAHEIAPGVFTLYGDINPPTPENQGFMANSTFILTDAGVVVIDTGSSVQVGEMLLRQIRARTDKPLLAVLNTHVHGDHWLGNQAMVADTPEVPIYGHPRMLELIAQGVGDQWLDIMMNATNGAVAGTEQVPPTQSLDDGDALTLGGLTIKAHHYPKVHSTTDLMFEIPELGLLFLADNANNGRIVRMDDGSFRGSVEALEDIRTRVPAAEVLIPGHGPVGGWEIIDAYLAYLTGLQTAVAELYDQGLSDFEMKPAVTEQLAAFQDTPGFDIELGKHISLVYLEVEAEAF
ncbi:MBL fold metallo-hydrolase [Thiohalocapsa marina]|uniref:MBL fold metallo-hydrolase n=1 Tax=Thiohalocapsa marina TaxID=424902 RepID=A0A5M8FPV6_9GAMM|nr:MBL fold metallo-hydrolase [Thiohalocapsa marina]KAA6186020.1 MBL fold metallo-hydrolase [Thiohalocapsa marina]